MMNKISAIKHLIDAICYIAFVMKYFFLKNIFGNKAI